LVLMEMGLREEGMIEHRAERKGDVRHSLADIGKARRDLGFVPAYDIREGLSLTMASRG